MRTVEFSLPLHFVEVRLISNSYRSRGEPDKAAPPGGEPEEPPKDVYCEDLTRQDPTYIIALLHL